MILGALAVCAMASCRDNDLPEQNLKPAYCPSSIEFNLPDEIRQLIYTDETGASVLPLIKGQTVTLSYILKPDTATFKDVEWTSTNPACATVDDNGLVSAVSGDGLGYSVVQVAPVGMFSGSGVNSTLKVKVDNELIPATGITITAPGTEVYAGETLQLTADITPANSTYRTVKWSSSNEAAAKVDGNGIVTGQVTSSVSTPVTITATSLDGTEVYATYEVIVKQIVQPQEVTINQTYSMDNGYACAVNEQQISLAYTTVPAECTTSLIQWSSSNEAIATVKDGVVTFNQNGNFGEVIITATCPETGKSSSIKLNVPAGLIRETFHNKDHYSVYAANQSGNGTATSTAWHDGYVTITTYKVNATTERADIKWWDTPVYLHAGNYPVIAVKVDDVKDMGYGITSRNFNFDCVGTSESGTSYKALGNGNNKYTNDYKCSDGSHVFIYDMSTLAFGTGGLAPVNESIMFTVFQLKYADMKTVDHPVTYNLYWFQTFKNISDVQKYIQREGLTYEVIK